MLIELEQLLTPEEVAALLKINVGTLANWRYSGHGPAWIDISDNPNGKNKRIRYAPSAIREYQERGRCSHASSAPETTISAPAGLRRSRKVSKGK